jgi:two-component system, LytTR family, response regulator
MNCIIIDDEPLAIQGMLMYIEKVPELKLIGSFENPIDAIKVLKENKIDLIFQDINMPEISGLDFVKTLTHSPMVIFATAYPQYALDSYELDAIDYLLKPIRFERFVKAINKAQQYLDLLQSNEINNSQVSSIGEDFMYIKTGKKFLKLVINNILYIEGLKDYVVIHTKEKKLIASMNLKAISDQLPEKIFARISRSYIVNTHHIELFANTELAIGNNFKDEFFKKYIDKKIVKR